MKAKRLPQEGIVLEVIENLQEIIWGKIASGVKGFIKSFIENLLDEELAVRERQEIRREIQQHWRHIEAIAVFAPLSFILVLTALKTTPVSYVAPARELSIVFGVFFGANILKEADAKKRIVAAIIMIIGISFLATG